MKKIFLSIISIISFNASSQIVHIPDANFKNALLMNLSINVNSDTSITVAEAAAYTGIMNVELLGINDLTGIEAFTAVWGIACANNSLDSIDLSQNTALEFLDCSYNQLQNIDLTNNTALREITCDVNQLQNINVSNCPLLTSFYCDYNPALLNIDFTNNTLLTNLWLTSSNIQSLDLSNNTMLVDLNLNNNKLQSLDLSNNTDLRFLNCNFNLLQSLNVTNNAVLSSLKCYYNLLQSLDVNNNTALTYLDCGENQLQSLNVSNNPALRTLELYNNTMLNLDVSNNTVLTRLNCGRNLLQNLDISNNTALTYLSCVYNQLQNLNVSNHSALYYIDCYGNQLQTLDVSTNTALLTLNIGSNYLQSLDISNNTLLKSLNCSFNSLNCLNIKNGNNSNFTLLNAINNPNLTCIEVDDLIWSAGNWSVANNNIDVGVSFSENCNNACTNCNAYFSLHRDTLTAYHWYALNLASGISPINYKWYWGDGDSSIGQYPSHTYDTAGYYNICLTITDNTGCTDTYCDSSAYIYKRGRAAITIDVVEQLPIVTTIGSLNNNHFSIYPNPTHNQLNITATLQGNDAVQYQIINTLGATAMASKATAKDFSIDVSTLLSGIYFIHLQSGTAKTVKRFVKE